MIFIILLINCIAFLVYGVLVLFTDHMIDEFTRYGMLKYRILTGYLEIFGGLGCLIGYFYSPRLLLLSTGGLSLLMLLGTLTRLRVGDPYFQIIPAFVLCLLNAFLAYHFAK